MKVYGDLHIHSALSPCSDEDMTPNNIVNMAQLKGLDFIAVTDHNSMKNVEVISKIADAAGILVVPGMEIESREEVHLLCLFKELEMAIQFDSIIYEKLPNIKNNINVFGNQSIFDEKDNVIAFEEKLLLNAVDIGIDQVYDIVRSMGGVVIPSHIDRQSNSIVSNLGTIPENLCFKYLELSGNCSENSLEKLKKTISNFDRYQILKSSDAHNLGMILEKSFFLEVSNLSLNAIIKTLSL